MNNIQYFELFKKAFFSAWKNKFLWFFGFLVFLGGATSNLTISSDDIAWLGNNFDFIGQLVAKFSNFTIIVSLVSFFVMIGFFLLRVIGIAAILKGANNPLLFKQLSKKNAFKEALSFFSRLLWIELLMSLALGIIFFTLSIPIFYLFSVNAKLFAFFALGLAVLIFLPLIILAYYLRSYANMFVVLGNFQVRMALDAAYVLFEKNLKKSLIMGVFSIITGIFLLILTTLLIVMISLIFAPFGFLAFWLFAKIGLIGVIVSGLILLLALLIVLFSIYQVFLQTAWLYFFQEIALEKEKDVNLVEKSSVNVEDVPSVEVG